MSSPERPVPPGSTPLRELAHAIASALTLPDDVGGLEEIAYLRAGRDRGRVVLFAIGGDEDQADGCAADELEVIP